MKANRVIIVIILLISIIGLSGCIETKKSQLQVVGTQGESKDFKLSDIQKMESITGKSQYQDLNGNWGGKGSYIGVPISSFAEEVGGIQQGDILIITSEDNSTQIYTYENVYPSTEWEEFQGTMILAYDFNDTKYPNWKDGLRIVFIPSDEQYSNHDCKNTSSLGFTEAAESRWIRNIRKLEFKREKEQVTFGFSNTNYTLSWSQILSFPSITESGTLIKSTGTIVGPYSFTGVNLSLLFDNLLKSDQKFGLDVIASDGYKMQYSKDQILGNVPIYNINGDQIGQGGLENLTLILAYYEGGNKISEDLGGPFRLVYVGPDNPITDGHFWVKYVSFINITSGYDDWTINLSGITTAEIGRDIFDSITFCPSGGATHYAFYNYTDPMGREVRYEGFPLYLAIAIIDSPHDAHYHFNLEQAVAGYDVLIKSVDGSSVILNSSYITQNTGLFLSHVRNGIALPKNEFPVRLIDSNLPQSMWLSQIESISMVNISDITLNFEITLTDLNNNQYTLNNSLYFFIASCYIHHVSVTINLDFYEGIPLYIIISIIDGSNPSNHYYDFNWNLAENPGYNITVIGYDGTNTTLTSGEIAGNISIILAYRKNGKLLNLIEGPISLQSPNLMLSERIQNVVEIKMIPNS